ncbi:DUF1007 family protein [Lentibacter sp. XHP0401]|jgi:ABC-type uncharacterized transport system substrate-binding protein|uniref:DUF1007 family protein n=1 Tax=Lentibacter sp. XHP0401 TaxID=2984334 RepID=UPI0021E8D653|nr:DUF1007 family protein [Lentibacter sp. XHP0401]MCV2892833.1 DUF1007 family protein [Lentibacter sp. XHP0401]
MRFLTALFICFAAPLGAHPHVFVETGLRLVVDESGQVAGVEVTWRYDELYSLLVLEDMELDSDFDGKLTQAELAQLDGFDLQWIEGFEGDLYAQAGAGKLVLGPPENRGTTVDAGHITSRHYRALADGPKALSLKAFDPTYYTAYDLGLGVHMPAGCKSNVVKADLEAAYKLEAELLGDDVDDPEADYPEVGEEFADEVIVTCASDS